MSEGCNIFLEIGFFLVPIDEKIAGVYAPFKCLVYHLQDNPRAFTQNVSRSSVFTSTWTVRAENNSKFLQTETISGSSAELAEIPKV